MDSDGSKENPAVDTKLYMVWRDEGNNGWKDGIGGMRWCLRKLLRHMLKEEAVG